jgi:hypothetical protein
MRRWFRRFLIAIPLLALLALGLWLSGSHRVTKANFDRIELGMTLAQVDELLAQSFKPGVAAEGGMADAFYWDDWCGTPPAGPWRPWPDGLVPTNVIWVSVRDGKVTSKEFYPWTFADLVKRVRGRLGL